MTVQVLKERPKDFNGLQLSVSKIKCFKQCPAQYQYQYIEKLPKKDTEYTIFGNFLHSVLEDFHKGLINDPFLLENELMSISFKDASKKYKGKIEKEARLEAHGILKKYLNLRLDEKEKDILPNVLGAEDKFYIDIDGEILFIGYIDRVQLDQDGMLHVADYKTSNKTKYLKKDDFQLKTYAFVKCLEDPEIERIRTSYIMLRLDFEVIKKEYSRVEALSMKDEIVKYADQIRKEKLFRPKTSPLCPWCPHLDICPEGQAVPDYRPKVLKFGEESSW